MGSFFKRVVIVFAGFTLLWISASFADYTILDSTSTTKTVKAFVCETTKICNGHVNIKSDGTEVFTTAAPGSISVADGANVALGTTTDAACATDNGTCTSVQLAKRANQRLTTLNTTLGTPFQAGGTAAATIADGSDAALGAKADAAWVSGSGSLISVAKTIATNTGAAIPAGTALIGKVGIDQTTPGTTNAVRSTAGATGGGTVSSAIAPATPAGVNLKASAGSVFRVFATTIQSTPVYVKLYNSASAPTCGSGTPIARFMVPAASTAANGAGTNIDIGDIGAAFGTGIGYCVTGALADNDTTAITANNTLVNIVWN